MTLRPQTWAELEALAAERAEETGAPVVVFTWPGSPAAFLLDVRAAEHGYAVALVAALPLDHPSRPEATE